MPPAARISDLHTCPMVTPGTPPVPHVGGPVITGFTTVLIGGQPAARVSDTCTCVGPPDTIVRGSAGVFIGGMPAARLGDTTVHGGVITTGCPTVLIGEISGGPAGLMGPNMGGAGVAQAQVRTLYSAAAAGAPFVRPCQ